MPSYSISKTWGPEAGFSCCFRQWRAKESHCRFLHGYALGVRFEFSSTCLDHCNWVYDFGNMEWIKAYLVHLFDHKTLVAMDDPELDAFYEMEKRGLIQLNVLPHTSCEIFAEHILAYCAPQVSLQTEGRVVLRSVTVFEHAANASRISLNP